MTGMVPEDVYELTGVADPRLSPDGATVAYVVGTVDKEANESRGAIWLAAFDGSTPPRRFTSGEKADADPRWSRTVRGWPSSPTVPARSRSCT